MDIHPANIASTLQQLQYPDAMQVQRQVAETQRAFSDLKLRQDTYTYENGSQDQLVNLHGTLPVNYKGTVYNIPIVLWLPKYFPSIPPTGFVSPTETMEIATSEHVDRSGKVYDQYLYNWNHGSTLVQFCHVMQGIFAQKTPVYARAVPLARPPPSTPHHAAAHNFHQPPAATPSPQPPAWQPPEARATDSTQRKSLQRDNSVDLDDDMIRLSLQSAVNDNIRRRLRDHVASSKRRVDPMVTSNQLLVVGQAELTSMQEQLRSEVQMVEGALATLRPQLARVRDNVNELERSAENLNIDEIIQGTAPLYNQVMKLVAQDSSYDDVLYMLSNLLKDRVVEIGDYLRLVRTLAQEQFMVRATIKKARAMAHLPEHY